MGTDIGVLWERLHTGAPGYPPQAFIFVQEGLRHTCERLHGADGTGSRHVSGTELCLGLRDYAVKQFGPLAKTVLRTWKVHRTDDFGRIVFAMVEAELLRKTDEDSMEDFENVYDFDEVFGAPAEAV